jgi:hypothetical protein
VINLTKFQGLWITLLKLWITPYLCGRKMGRWGGIERN